MSTPPLTSLYLHIPFCSHRCAYCDFNTYAGLETLIPAYVAALQVEIRLIGEAARQQYGTTLPVHTIFFGGGTPSLLDPQDVAAILAETSRSFDMQPAAEITLEANPGTITASGLRQLRQAGVNRLSFGVQASQAEALRLLERQHDFPAVICSVAAARQARFDNLSLDLMFGLPYQTLDQWEVTLQRALDLHPQHLSLYALTLEHGTPMQAWTERGLLPTVDDDLAATMYELASERLKAAGFEQYEISNWARRDADENLLACKHNLQYWRGLPYLGLGAGAHGYANGVRTVAALAPNAYIQRMQASPDVRPYPLSPATVSRNEVSRDDEIGELMMMSLRLLQEGVSELAFASRFDQSLGARFSQPIEHLQRLGLLEWQGRAPDRRLRLTRQGRLLGNRVFREFV